MEIFTQEQAVYLVLIAIVAILACLQVYFYFKLSRLEQRQNQLFAGTNGKDLETMLLTNWEGMNQLMQQTKELKDVVERHEMTYGRSLRRIGLVRYDAFKDVSGNMSYSLALLNDAGSGLVLTGIFTQEQGRSYVKAVRNWGPSENALTEEEEKAIKLAYKDTGAISH
jgi:hypothetical protein